MISIKQNKFISKCIIWDFSTLLIWFTILFFKVLYRYTFSSFLNKLPLYYFHTSWRYWTWKGSYNNLFLRMDPKSANLENQMLCSNIFRFCSEHRTRCLSTLQGHIRLWNLCSLSVSSFLSEILSSFSKSRTLLSTTTLVQPGKTVNIFSIFMLYMKEHQAFTKECCGANLTKYTYAIMTHKIPCC